MPIAFGSTSLSPKSFEQVDQTSTDRLPVSTQNGSAMYCVDAAGMDGGSFVFKTPSGWSRVNGNNVVPNSIALWRSGFSEAKFDPASGAFNPTIISDITTGGVRKRQLYIDITFAGQTFQIFLLYCVPTSTPPVGGFPCLFVAQGWQGYPQEYPAYNSSGWATFGFDYTGQRGDSTPCTNYPNSLSYGRHFTAQGGYLRTTTFEDGTTPISDPRQTSEYLWACVMRRAFEYLLTQPEINTSQIGMRGHSYGGTLAWNMTMEPRMKAIVSYFGNGWTTYYRDKLLWKYQIPATTYPAFTSGEKIYLTAPTAEQEARYACVPILLINGSNDHHGGHDRVDDTFAKIPENVPWDFSHDANKGHNVSINIGNELLWLNKYVLGSAITWSKRPFSWISKVAGVPQFNVQPDTSLAISSVEFWKCEVEPFNVNRVWISTPTTNDGKTWIGSMPVTDPSKYLFAYANIIYSNGVVTSTKFNAVIPNQI